MTLRMLSYSLVLCFFQFKVLVLGWIERLVGISIENEWKKTGTWAKIEKISDQMKTCSGWMDGFTVFVWYVLKMNEKKNTFGSK